MVETSSEWRVNCFWFPKKIAILVAIASFIIIPNDRFHSVMVTAYDDFINSKNDINVVRNFKRRFNCKSEGDDVDSPCNPLWREGQIYNGDRRKPVSTPDSDDSSSLRRPRRIKGRNSQPNSPLAPHIHNIDDVSSAKVSKERYREQQQRRRQPVQYELEDNVIMSNSYSDFPLQSADIGSTGSRTNDVRPKYNQIPRFSIERGRRKWSFPIDFRRQRGRLNIGYSADDEPKRRRFNRCPRFSKVGARGLLTAHDEEPTPTTTKAASRNAKTRRNVFSFSRIEKFEHTIQQLTNHTAVTVTPTQPSSSRTGMSDKKHDVQVSFSLDPFSFATLLQNGAASIVEITSVYVGTLKLLPSMILAKQCLTTIGSIFNNRFNGQHVREVSTKRICNLEKSHLDKCNDIATARAATRIGFQFLFMSFAGRCVEFALDQAPCILRPFWICQWWYGVVWLASIYAMGFVCQEWVFCYLAQTNMKIHSFLSIQPTSNPMHLTSRNKSVNIQHRRGHVAQPIFRFLQRISRNSEEWMNPLFRFVPLWQNRSNYRRGRKTIDESENVDKPDPLLLPSTWKPLSVLTFLALSRAICQSFCINVSPPDLVGKIGDVVCRKNNQYFIMRSFIIQKTLHNEWYRVFVQERRVVLGAGLSVIGLLTLMWTIYSVSTVDASAAMAMVPILMARVVSTWNNILLSYIGFDPSAETITWGNLASRLNTAHD